ncbi:hypothetical protein Q9L58_002243 [Maublancomyces gigas]|uniref:PAW domain-containing protein n=1 Tax=Discina gigas TaxID=1032678 RepID=A0ABR3GS78_9PEZI
MTTTDTTKATRIINMPPFTCRPDKYLNEVEMTALFDDFDLSLKNGHSSAAIFSSLVNNVYAPITAPSISTNIAQVRQVYLSALLDTREELLDQYKEHGQELTKLTHERGDDRGSPPQYGSGAPETTTTSSQSDAVHGQGAGAEIGQAPEGEITWPAVTFPLHVGSYSADYRRDKCTWENMDKDGWTERLVFNVFKYQEPGTFKVAVTINTTGSRRVMVNREPWNTPGWDDFLEFYAYERQRPGTHMVWIAYRSDPERCIFLKGSPTDVLPGWERRLEFWAPK